MSERILQDRIAKLLVDYRLHHVLIDDSPGDHLPLVDALSGDGDIGVGRAEIAALAETLAEEIDAPPTADHARRWIVSEHRSRVYGPDPVRELAEEIRDESMSEHEPACGRCGEDVMECVCAEPEPPLEPSPNPVRELAEEIARAEQRAQDANVGDVLPWDQDEYGIEAKIRHWEARLGAFLAEREGEWRKDYIKNAPDRERQLARSLSAQTRETERLQEVEERFENQAGQLAAMRTALEELVATVRGECPSLLSEDTVGALLIEDAIASGAGRLESEVIRAAHEVRRQAPARWGSRAFQDAVLCLFDRVDDLDALRAARGGEG